MPKRREEPGADGVDPRSARARQRFAALVTGNDDRFDVAEAALWICAEDRPETDVDGSLARLVELGSRVRSRLEHARERRPGANLDEMAIAALHGILFEDEGFRGASAEWYARPEASFLDAVLDRKRGLPILLSIVYCAVARRAGLDAVGIGLPGHFVAEFRGQSMRVLVDPFDGGRRLSVADAEAIVERVTGRAHPSGSPYLQAVPSRRVVARVLENLKRAYAREREHGRALEVVERLLLVAPTLENVRDRGLLLREVTMPDGANLMASWFDLRLYARHADAAPDAEAVGRLADVTWRELGRMN